MWSPRPNEKVSPNAMLENAKAVKCSNIDMAQLQRGIYTSSKDLVDALPKGYWIVELRYHAYFP